MWGSWLIYPIEYMCTREETTRTGINIDTVKESKLKPHNTLRDSESIHLNRLTSTDMLFTPTSKKLNIESIDVSITQVHVIKWDPFTPTFLPKKPDIIDLIKAILLKLSTLFKFYSYTSS